ncbi:MAG TPA: hypothetical protein VL485_05375 [Ktedonobacteraceae bacterium]|jgi:hypothetical protein|nr:hypothetical protein [Ktedonobacteraceae bacterium]
MQCKTYLERCYYEKYLLEIAIVTLERGGVTSKVDTHQFLDAIDAWGLPKYPGRTVILTPEADLVEELRQFIDENEQDLLEPDTWLGTWVDPQTQRYYLDLTIIRPVLEEAKREAMERSRQEGRSIVAVYNFKRNLTVYL